MLEDHTPEEFYTKALPEVIRVTTKILKIEKEFLFTRKKQGLTDEIVKVFKEEVQ